VQLAISARSRRCSTASFCILTPQGLPTPSGHSLRPCAREGEYKSAACSDRKVRLAGDTVFVTGRAAIEAEINGQPRSLRLVFLNAWTRTAKGWKFIAWQSTPQPTT